MSKRRKGEIEIIGTGAPIRKAPARKRANVGLVVMEEAPGGVAAPVIIAPAPNPEAFGGIVPFLIFLKGSWN